MCTAMLFRSLLVLLTLDFVEGEFMITAVGDIDGGFTFVELYTTSDIPDLGIYTLNTPGGFTQLPFGQSLSAGNYVIVSKGTQADFQTFFGGPIPDFCSILWFNHNSGDSVQLKIPNGQILVDTFGTTGQMGYASGYATRVQGATAPKDTYDPADWNILPGALVNCWTAGNAACTTPFQYHTWKRE